MRTERPLTPGQREVLRLTCAGLTAAEVAARLGMSVGRVRAIRHNTYQKLRVTSRADACLALEG